MSEDTVENTEKASVWTETVDSAEKERLLLLELERLRNLTARRQADFENLQRNSVKSQAAAAFQAKILMASDLLPIVDALEKAATISTEKSPLTEGIAMVLREARRALLKHDIVEFVSNGQPFDPRRHEAVMMEESDAHEEPTVLRTFIKGYCIGDNTILRPASVVVSKKPARVADATPPESESGN